MEDWLNWLFNKKLLTSDKREISVPIINLTESPVDTTFTVYGKSPWGSFSRYDVNLNGPGSYYQYKELQNTGKKDRFGDEEQEWVTVKGNDPERLERYRGYVTEAANSSPKDWYYLFSPKDKTSNKKDEETKKLDEGGITENTDVNPVINLPTNTQELPSLTYPSNPVQNLTSTQTQSAIVTPEKLPSFNNRIYNWIDAFQYPTFQLLPLMMPTMINYPSYPMYPQYPIYPQYPTYGMPYNNIPNYGASYPQYNINLTYQNNKKNNRSSRWGAIAGYLINKYGLKWYDKYNSQLTSDNLQDPLATHEVTHETGTGGSTAGPGSSSILDNKDLDLTASKRNDSLLKKRGGYLMRSGGRIIEV